ncbi:hypothetical protein WDU94_011715 [Cyamophila willieti]
MQICGPKLALCGCIISVWGIIQLALMGVFYQMRSVALAEDLPGVEHHFATADEYLEVVNKGYTLNAYNCWIAAVLYFLTLLLSAQQFHANTRSSISL